VASRAERAPQRSTDTTGPTGRGAASMMLLAAGLGFFVITVDANVVVVALPQIGRQLHGGLSGLQWVSAGYTTIFAALLLSAGSLSDRYGASRMYFWGLALFTAASACSGLAPDVGALIGARLVQGGAAALLLPATLALVREAYPDAEKRTRAIAIWTACGGVAVAAGPVIGGLLTTAAGWRWIFFVNLPIGLAGLVIVRLVPVSPARWAPFDWPGQATVVIAMAALTLAVIQGGKNGWGFPLVIGAFIAAAVAAAAFVTAESRVAHPVLPPGFFRSRPVTACTLTGLSLNFAFYGAVFVLSLFFQQIRGQGALTAGLMFLPTTALVTIANLAAGKMTRRFGARLPLAAGQLILAAGLLVLLVVGRGTPAGEILGLVVPLGIGGGLSVPPLTAALLDAVAAARAGLASGVLNAGRQLGGALGVAIFGVLLTGGFVMGMRICLVVGAALLILTTILSLAFLRPQTAGRPR
jgi:MFS transporter, DHA2 family, methylenomycin A resistance protein